MDQITHFKVPSAVRFVDEFPMTVSGKIQKFKMRDAMITACPGSGELVQAPGGPSKAPGGAAKAPAGYD